MIREVDNDVNYSSDYNTVKILHDFAAMHQICLVAVHHTRKQNADDSFEKISGTNGLLGAANGAYIMTKEDRTDDTACIEFISRDLPDKKITVKRDLETRCWDFLNESSQEFTNPVAPIISMIGNFITPEEPEWQGTATELIEQLSLNIKPNKLAQKLNANTAKLYINFFIKYEKSTNHHKGKVFTLRYDFDHPIINRS